MQLIVSPYSTHTVGGGQGLRTTKMVQLSAPFETAGNKFVIEMEAFKIRNCIF